MTWYDMTWHHTTSHTHSQSQVTSHSSWLVRTLYRGSMKEGQCEHLLPLEGDCLYLPFPFLSFPSSYRYLYLSSQSVSQSISQSINQINLSWRVRVGLGQVAATCQQYPTNPFIPIQSHIRWAAVVINSTTLSLIHATPTLTHSTLMPTQPFTTMN